MKHMVSYTLKPDRVTENERLAAAVYDALKQARPAGLRYATFRLEDGVSFIHIVSHDEPDGSNFVDESDGGVPGVELHHDHLRRRRQAWNP